MKIQEKLLRLAQLGEPAPVISRSVKLKFFPVTTQRGCISVKDNGDHWSVIWTNGNGFHLPLVGPSCRSADFRKDSGMPYARDQLDWTGAWRSALSLWPVYKKDQAEADRIFEFIRNCVDLAFEELERSRAA